MILLVMYDNECLRIASHRSLRARLEDLGSGAAQLLESMLHFDPSKR